MRIMLRIVWVLLMATRMRPRIEKSTETQPSTIEIMLPRRCCEAMGRYIHSSWLT